MTTEEIRVNFSTNLDASGIESGAEAGASALGGLEAAFEKTEKQGQGLISTLSKFGGKGGGSAGGGASGLAALSAALGPIGIAAAAAVAGIAAVATGVKKFADRAEEGAKAVRAFEGSLSSIQSSTMGTEAEISALSEAFTILGAESGRGAGDFAQYASQLTSFGVSQEQSLRTLISAVNISNAEGKDLDKVFSALAQTFEGSNTEAVKLGLNVAGINKEALKHGAAIEKIEEKYGQSVVSSSLISDAQKESALLSDEIDKQFAKIFESSEFIRDAWDAIVVLFQKAYLASLKFIDFGLKKIEDILFDYKLLLTDIAKFLKLDVAAEALGFGGKDKSKSSGDGTGADAAATVDESGAKSRNKRLADLLALLNDTNRQTNFKADKAIKEVKKTTKAVKEEKPLTIGNILGDARTLLSMESQQAELSQLIGTTLGSESLGDELRSLFGDGIDINPDTVVQLANGSPEARQRLADIFASQKIANEIAEDIFEQQKEDAADAKERANEALRKERDRQDSITVSSITSEASGLNTAADLAKSFEDNLRRLNIELSAQEAESLAKVNEPFRQTLLTGFAKIEREDEAARKAQEAAEKEAKALAEAQLELEKQAQETRMKILGGINAGIGIVSAGAAATTSDADIANIEDDAQRDEASLANLDVGIAAAKDITQQVSDAFGPVIGTIANAFLNIFTLDSGQIETFFQNLASGFTIIIEKISQNLSPIIKAIVKAIPVISKALINAIPAVIEAIIDLIPFLIQHIVELIPDMLMTIANVLRVLIQNAFALWANTWLTILSSIPLIGEAFSGLSVPYAQLEGGSRDNLQSYNQLSDRVEAARTSTGGGGGGDDDRGSGVGERRQRLEAQRGISIGGVTRTDSVLTAAEAFNPYFDSGRQRQRQPIQLQIQIGNQRLRDILTDLDESGYNRVVTA